MLKLVLGSPPRGVDYFGREALIERLWSRLERDNVLLAVSGGPSAPLEPVLLRTRAPRRDTICWKRGETTASPAEIMAFNGITPESLPVRARGLLS